MTRITVKAWTDPDFKSRLLSEPMEILENEGVKMPKSKIKVHFHENTSHERHFVLPAPPEVLTLRDKDLTVLAAQRLAIQLELF